MSERWRQVKALFQSALEQDGAERAAYLDSQCGADSDLRARVEALLSSHERAAAFLEQPAIDRLPDDPAAGSLDGRRIGPYAIGALIGEGGMGVVHQAVRADDVFRKRVAIKVVKRGMDTEAVLRRFQHERQTLASLDHAGIAKILDGGTTPDGRPYFVMEFVEGEPLDLFCDQRMLSVVDRLKLFRMVCSAVHYAHQNLVVHRDIKPDNILVASDGAPRLVDFGIAKVLGPASAFHTQDVTAGSPRFLTYEYASPEQVRGEPITTATDVYSLGVVLYELLTGRRPHERRGRPLSEFERVICEDEPPKPSAVVPLSVPGRVGREKGAGVDPIDPIATIGPIATIATAATTVTTATAAPARAAVGRQRLNRDLDMIVLKAIHKAPTRRYASVEQLGEDVRRHLEGLPVIALPDTLRYRARKFVTRHKAEVAAAGLLLVSLVAGIVATAWQARVASVQRSRAERRFNDVRALANAVVFEMHDAIATLPGSTPVRQLLVKRALAYLASLAQDASTDPALQRELAAAYRKIGDVQGNPYGANLGDSSGAMDSYRRALAILESVQDSGFGGSDTQREIAAVHERIGDIKAITSDVAGALDSQREALAIREALARTASSSDDSLRELADSHKKVAESLLWKGDAAGGLTHAREGLRLRESIARREGASAAAQAALASSLTNVGEMLIAGGDNAAALEHFRTAVKVAAASSEREPTNAPLRRQRAIALSKVGETLAGTDDLAGAAASHRQALEARRDLASADPANTQARRDVAISHIMLADTLRSSRERPEALEHVRQSLAIFEGLAGEPGNTSAQADLAQAHGMAGTIRLRVGDTVAAIESFEQAVARAEAVTSGDAADVDTRRGMIQSYRNLGDAYDAAARAPTASRAARTAHWTNAKQAYQKARDLLLSIRTAARLTAEDEQQIEATSRRIAACEEELNRLTVEGREARR